MVVLGVCTESGVLFGAATLLVFVGFQFFWCMCQCLVRLSYPFTIGEGVSKAFQFDGLGEVVLCFLQKTGQGLRFQTC